MGWFKDLREMKKAADELSASVPRPGLRETIAMSKDAMAGATEQLAAMQLQSDPNARVGRAHINAIRDTGTTINENPVIEFQLTVTDSDGSVYALIHSQIVGRLQIPQVQPGADVMVKIDPADRNRVLIV